jgi:hypothetical protein
VRSGRGGGRQQEAGSEEREGRKAANRRPEVKSGRGGGRQQEAGSEEREGRRPPTGSRK